ncbi:DUF5682 family protein [Kineosporia succinea]|uniref:Uncharacterized protein with von Willebrand factor type A (VWA) domain n=1 Tax=Kineosporia succinea TaxID=84632 RepID=A0ABT9P4I3_9ACTN|nr:DUF5682 family protein [Kineosporia succinea]MDP9827608.1 uncharacterized protein with von Willebrand factor type A (vWA) domain [Kineosporia succinea]
MAARKKLPDPQAAVGEMVAAQPYLIGVRHHSPALSAVIPALLDELRPQSVLIEMPPQFERWTTWLGHPDTMAPVALAGSGEPLPFYPFADFSPELVAIRWAVARGVPVVACDLPLGDEGWGGRSRAKGRGKKSAVHEAPSGDHSETGSGAREPFAQALRRSQTGRDGDDLWDRVVEAPAPGATPEQVRRAALAVGWALRADEAVDGRVASVDLRREAQMRAVVADHRRRHPDHRVALLVGAFHAPALVSAENVDPASQTAELEAPRPVAEVTTSLIPYADPLLDSRSGYPAGIRDPRWQAETVRAGGDPAKVSAAASRVAVEVCAQIREGGHPAGPGEAREVVRLTEDLARLRGLPAPGRSEIVEALSTVLTQGETLGRGRVVARAMERVLVGERRGRLAPGTPRSGLGPSLEALLKELKLPNPEAPQRKELRLDPLRSPLDRRREITLQRTQACGIYFALPGEVQGVGAAAALTTLWLAEWTPSTAALTEIAGLLGVTLEQASDGTLRRQRERERAEGGSTASQVLEGLLSAAECGLPGLTAERLDDTVRVLPATATLPELLIGLDLLSRLEQDTVPGLVGHPLPDLGLVIDEVHSAAIRQVDGLAGSTDPADARALLALVVRHDRLGTGLRLDAALKRLTHEGSPLMRGAGAAVRVLLGLDDAADLGDRAAAWLDLDAPLELTARLSGLLIVAGPLLEAGGDVLDPLLARLEVMPDDLFLRRLPAVRGGFDVLTPAARARLLAAVESRLDDRLDLVMTTDPVLLGRWAQADAHALEALRERGLASAVALAPADRWRLVLGQKGELRGQAKRYGQALDELYGQGRGEGAGSDLQGSGAGDGPGYPGVREWSEDLTQLFGATVREEVLAAAAAGGRVDAALAIDPASARPSVELLTSVLSLAGALPERTVARLRPLVAKVVSDLTQELSRTLTPALTGLTSSRPTRRAGGPIDLHRTIRANLKTARYRPDGTATVIPEHPVFKTRSKRTTDWRIILLVDVSGSMEASTVWSAITAAVLSGVPALTTHLLAFSTEVIDFTGVVSDPLSLLLEVSVGGGTSIATGLAAARELVTVPSRTMVVVVSDFEEGGSIGPLLAQVRMLVDAGVRVLGCAGLDESGAARYSVSVAGQLVGAGMPVAALSPLELARWVGEQVR